MGESLLDTASLLDNLLFWAKSQMNGLQARPQEFDIVPVLKQNAQLIGSRALKKKILLSLDAPPEPLTVFADQAMVDLVIRNLLDNALKFSGEGDIVRLSTAITPKGVEISVSDTGKGIPDQYQSKIFNTVSFTTPGTSYEKGSGLGLSLCKDMIERNNGNIWFESTAGVGTTFTFLLPIAG
jgi:signal transduction histidine kinase